LIVRPGVESYVELYDLHEDPDETHNLAPTSPTLVEQLRRQYEAGPEAAKPNA
jgi:hypothetical protein